MGRTNNIESNILSILYIESHRQMWYSKAIMEEVSELNFAPPGGEIYASVKSTTESGQQICKGKL